MEYEVYMGKKGKGREPAAHEKLYIPLILGWDFRCTLEEGEGLGKGCVSEVRLWAHTSFYLIQR